MMRNLCIDYYFDIFMLLTYVNVSQELLYSAFGKVTGACGSDFPTKSYVQLSFL